MPAPSIGEQVLQQLTLMASRVEALEATLPVRNVVWLRPQQMARLCHCSSRTLQNYVKTGRLSPRSYRRQPRGKGFNYQYHRELTMKELGLI